MAKLISSNKLNDTKRKRPGVHSKKRSSNNKHSRNYKKKYRGQGR